MIRILLFILIVMSCAGCQPLVSGHQGIDVSVYPVTYQLSVRADTAPNREKVTQEDSEAGQVWQQFQARHKENILISELSFRYAGKAGETMARQWRDALIARGADAGKLKLKNDEELKNFDLQVRLVVYQTVTPFCYPPKVGSFGHQPTGCFVDSAGWLSMVHPEDALPDQTQSEHLGN
ncbi:hypothetical protein [Vibrio quintilis]|uniref:Lipoprotein n=1 Tax=Vibrio quintilis TaxID=1117707 RepID=A0A1M7YV65_9VIBR|nr:hypothetical protein [Vibrio quintilis]SHO56524.1 hypothetical protein VQ7734_02293 [Vibrio quintilis]